VTSVDNILIVEDDRDWSEFYERAVEREGKASVRIARSFEDARVLLAAMTFAVALVDIRLDEHDDSNVDGLRVMEEIVRLNDETSIIMITGKGTVQITRDALKKYKALDAFDKSHVNPSDIGSLLKKGLEAYSKAVASKDLKVQNVLCGDLAPWKWEDEMLRATGVTGGVRGLYDFLEGLFLRFLPVVGRRKGEPVRVDSGSFIAHGQYWSRAIARPLFVCFGREDRIAAAVEERRSGQGFLGNRNVGDIIRDYSCANVRGLVFELVDQPRGSFEG
jgi:ActR/RegA family two-component response regulator